jgi:hypothetical protein
MNNYFESADGGEGDFVRLSQYNDLIWRPIQWMNRERRLLWAFLDDVIRGYLWIMRRSTKSSERRSSKSDWFYRRPGFDNGLFGVPNYLRAPRDRPGSRDYTPGARPSPRSSPSPAASRGHPCPGLRRAA